MPHGNVIADPHFGGTFWPSDVQERLLVAALGEEREALEAWQAVRPLLVIDKLETGSFELLPLIYSNLTRAGFGDEELPRLKGSIAGRG